MSVRKNPHRLIIVKTVSPRFLGCFLIRSFSYLQVTRTYISACMSSNFGQIPLLTSELAALERLKNQCRHFFSVAIDQIHFKFVSNEKCNISRTSSNFGQIGPPTTELSALERPFTLKTAIFCSFRFYK